MFNLLVETNGQDLYWIFYICGATCLLLAALCGYFGYKSSKNKWSSAETIHLNEFKQFWYKNRMIIWFLLAVVLLMVGISFMIMPTSLTK